jgi:uncharacterized membrane protein
MTDESKNLTVARGDRSVWDPPGFGSRMAGQDRSRLMTVLWGSALFALAARRRSFAGGLIASLGGIAAVRAAMGHHDYAVARDCVDRWMKRAGWRATDGVDDTVEDSFPASDPPQWTATTVSTNRG